jgi:hypothetical protein
VRGNCRQFPETTGSFRKLPAVSQKVRGNCRQFPETTGSFPKSAWKLPAVTGNCREFSTHFRMMTKKKIVMSSCKKVRKNLLVEPHFSQSEHDDKSQK